MNSAPDAASAFSHEFDVSEKDTDRNRHVNNVVYLQWMQDIAILHSERSGGMEAMQELGCTWVVRSHKVEYLAPAFAGDRIEASTWVEGYRRVRALRRYCFTRKADRKILARGETEWIFIDNQSGKPCSIPDRIKRCYPAAIDN